ncbi:NADPH-dependent FMN reductase [Bacillus kwashiorkori]|uniref:NADPH-dependent FMN reductase n=1 Tax=Bacillus kwashiorkori TaxID=1522318 RepID=UPI001EEFC2A4|nr:NADPH-dependent FMN reductase [Bacillus kwashiorkori]
MMRLVCISGSLIGEKLPKVMGLCIKEAERKNPNLKTEMIDLRDYQIQFVDGRPREQYNTDTQETVAKILAADILLIGSPVYQASISGVLKNLFDHLPMNSLDGKIVGLVMTAGTEKHYLVMEHQLRPIITFLKGFVVTKNVFIHTNQLDEELEDEEVVTRIQDLVQEVLEFKKAL